jgi:hypothetical protein
MQKTKTGGHPCTRVLAQAISTLSSIYIDYDYEKGANVNHRTNGGRGGSPFHLARQDHGKMTIQLSIFLCK